MTDSSEATKVHDSAEVEPRGMFLYLGRRRLRLELLLLGVIVLLAVTLLALLC